MIQKKKKNHKIMPKRTQKFTMKCCQHDSFPIYMHKELHFLFLKKKTNKISTHQLVGMMKICRLGATMFIRVSNTVLSQIHELKGSQQHISSVLHMILRYKAAMSLQFIRNLALECIDNKCKMMLRNQVVRQGSQGFLYNK